ncbi:MAG: hypothetical protein ACQEQ8_00935 [Pseudomonadota bacterium]
MKQVKQGLLNSFAFLLLVTATGAQAQEWTAEGNGKVIYPSGRSEALNFGFGYEQTFDTYQFKAGKAKMRTDEMPPNYILNTIINKEGLIYIGEFADGFFESFELNIGEHFVAIKPRKEFDEDEPYKHLVVIIDDNSYLLDTTHPSLKFHFNESGIEKINGKGLIRDLSSHRR